MSTAWAPTGRGGWTWYTGSAAWMYRLGLEGILGLHRARAGLIIQPHIPAGWPGYEVTYHYGQTTYAIGVRNDGPRAGTRHSTWRSMASPCRAISWR